MSLPLVSVIIPFFNVEPFLRETIESVFNQDYTNWQLILVDDGSTDDSTTIAKEYASKFPSKVFYTNHPAKENRGVCATRNLGIKNAIGEIIAFLDSDDVWSRKKLSEQIGLVLKYPNVAMFCEASVYWYSWDQTNKKDDIVFVGVPADHIYQPPYLALHLYPLKKAAAPCPSSIIIRRELLNKIGGFEEIFVGKVAFFEDQAFLFKVYMNAPVFVSSSSNNFYRIHKKSAMAPAREQREYKRAGVKFFLIWAKTYLNRNGNANREIVAVLNKALDKYESNLIRKIWKKFKSTFYRV